MEFCSLCAECVSDGSVDASRCLRSCLFVLLCFFLVSCLWADCCHLQLKHGYVFYMKLNICLQGPWGYEFAICMMTSEVREEQLLVTACFSWSDPLWAWRPPRHPTKANCVTDLGWKMDGCPWQPVCFQSIFICIITQLKEDVAQICFLQVAAWWSLFA